jgi:methanogenic corrinoid protein MtbC1
MEPEMNAPDSHTLLIEKIKALEEAQVLALVRERIQAGDDPLKVIESAQEGMRQVGSLYEQREYFISGLMMAGEIFREVMEIVEPALVQTLSGDEAGHILLGTTQGDIHDIGKSIFKTMLQCYGFTVTDLGVDIVPQSFVEQALALQPDIIAMSGLLTSSYDSMRSTVEELRKQAVQTPFIIGGGLINANVCAYVGAQYWAVDAMLGVNLCKEIMAAG